MLGKPKEALHEFKWTKMEPVGGESGTTLLGRGIFVKIQLQNFEVWDIKLPKC
jgi:hypothetical protein